MPGVWPVGRRHRPRNYTCVSLSPAEWSPQPSWAVGRLVVAGVLAGAAVLVVADVPGRLLVGLAAAGSALTAAHDLLVRPRLAARPDGLVVRSWGRRRRLGWPGLRVRVRAVRRLGTTVRSLELDLAGPHDDGTLVVLGRRDLGAPVDEVARALRSLQAELPGAPRPAD